MGSYLLGSIRHLIKIMWPSFIMLLLLYVSSNFILPRMSMNEGHVNCTFGGVPVKNFSVGRLDVQNF